MDLFARPCIPFALGRPSLSLAVGTSNPSGLRRKEPILAGLGPGISVKSSFLRSRSSVQERRFGHWANTSTVTSAYTRPGRSSAASNSEWAGSWSGVLTLSDWPSRQLSIAMQPGVYETGRIHLVQHVVNGLPLLTTNLYGHASGQARACNIGGGTGAQRSLHHLRGL